MKRMKQLSYHHILERSKGGKSTVENGAILSNENHIWFHKQSESKQGYLNAIFQEYKRQSDACKVVFVETLETDYEIRVADIALDEKGRLLSEEKKQEYNRAKEKQELRKMSEEYVDR